MQTYCGYSIPLGKLVDKLREKYAELKRASLEQYELELLDLHEQLHQLEQTENSCQTSAACDGNESMAMYSNGVSLTVGVGMGVGGLSVRGVGGLGVAMGVSSAGKVGTQPRVLNELYRRRLESSELSLQALPGAPVEQGFEEVEVIRCICGAIHDQGVMVQCDKCYVSSFPFLSFPFHASIHFTPLHFPFSFRPTWA